MGCPVKERFDPFDHEYLVDPYPVLARLRDERPVFYSADLGMWVVTRYRDVEAIFRDPGRFSAANAFMPVTPMAPEARDVLRARYSAVPILANGVPPAHTRVRALNVRTFSARHLAVLEPAVRRRASELIDALPDGEVVDLVPRLTFPLPAFTIFRLLGFPDEDAERIKAWSGDRLDLFWGRLPPEDQVRVAERIVEYWEYCVRFVESRIAEPRDDFTSELARAHLDDRQAISPAEIASVVMGIGVAGHETTTSILGNAVRHVVPRPDVWRAVRENPERRDQAVEEVLRLDTSVIGWRRITTEPVEVGGVAIPENAHVLLLLGAANRDPSVFEDPDEFRLGRPNARQHLSFGKGIHFCLGAPLARMQTRIVLELLASRWPALQLAPDQSYEFSPNLSFRGLRRLLVVCRARTRGAALV